MSACLRKGQVNVQHVFSYPLPSLCFLLVYCPTLASANMVSVCEVSRDQVQHTTTVPDASKMLPRSRGRQKGQRPLGKATKIHVRIGDNASSVVQFQGEKVIVHVWFQGRFVNKMIQTQTTAVVSAANSGECIQTCVESSAPETNL